MDSGVISLKGTAAIGIYYDILQKDDTWRGRICINPGVADADNGKNNGEVMGYVCIEFEQPSETEIDIVTISYVITTHCIEINKALMEYYLEQGGATGNIGLHPFIKFLKKTVLNNLMNG